MPRTRRLEDELLRPLLDPAARPPDAVDRQVDALLGEHEELQRKEKAEEEKVRFQLD